VQCALFIFFWFEIATFSTAVQNLFTDSQFPLLKKVSFLKMILSSATATFTAASDVTIADDNATGTAAVAATATAMVPLPPLYLTSLPPLPLSPPPLTSPPPMTPPPVSLP
jgi:hypothetical protein